MTMLMIGGCLLARVMSEGQGESEATVLNLKVEERGRDVDVERGTEDCLTQFSPHLAPKDKVGAL